jgi:glycosyltransferase involved in cell wall biosynthesis
VRLAYVYDSICPSDISGEQICPTKDASIIILTKNAGSDFQDTLEPIFVQRYLGEFGAITVDSGSAGNTLETVRNYPTKVHQMTQ